MNIRETFCIKRNLWFPVKKLTIFFTHLYSQKVYILSKILAVCRDLLFFEITYIWRLTTEKEWICESLVFHLPLSLRCFSTADFSYFYCYNKNPLSKIGIDSSDWQNQPFSFPDPHLFLSFSGCGQRFQDYYFLLESFSVSWADQINVQLSTFWFWQ